MVVICARKDAIVLAGWTIERQPNLENLPLLTVTLPSRAVGVIYCLSFCPVSSKDRIRDYGSHDERSNRSRGTKLLGNSPRKFLYSAT